MLNTKSRTHRTTEEKFSRYRQEAIDGAIAVLPIQYRSIISYSGITHKALIEARSWQDVNERRFPGIGKLTTTDISFTNTKNPNALSLPYGGEESVYAP